MNSILRRCCLPGTAVALIVTLVPAAAQAGWSSAKPPEKSGIVAAGAVADPDDTRGRLDIARVSDKTIDIGRGHYLMSYLVRTQAPLRTARLDVAHRNFVLELNRDGERGSERSVRVAARDGELVAEVISNASREVIATVMATQRGDRAIRITGPRRLVGARSYTWASNFHARRSPGCGRGDGFPIVCQDDVPQRGWLRLQRPAWPGETSSASAIAKRSEALG